MKYLFIAAAAVLFSVPPALAQIRGGIPVGAMPSSPGFLVSDAATEMNTYITALSVATGGVAGLHGALIAGANQQATQPAELQRLDQLELENATAAGVLQALEVGNEIGMFASEQDMKLRNATNAQLNALVVAESNRQNKVAQDELESLSAASTPIQNWPAI